MQQGAWGHGTVFVRFIYAHPGTPTSQPAYAGHWRAGSVAGAGCGGGTRGLLWLFLSSLFSFFFSIFLFSFACSCCLTKRINSLATASSGAAH